MIHFYEYMTSYNSLHQKHYGFRANQLCENAFILMVDTWLSALNKGNQIGVLHIDLCKVFDVVDHDLLIRKKLQVQPFLATMVYILPP